VTDSESTALRNKQGVGQSWWLSVLLGFIGCDVLGAQRPVFWPWALAWGPGSAPWVPGDPGSRAANASLHLASCLFLVSEAEALFWGGNTNIDGE
jgi:hypothetical protein